VSAIPGHGPDEEREVSYKDVKVIGKGTFGVVYRAKLCETGQMVAIKKVFHNEKFKVIHSGLLKICITETKPNRSTKPNLATNPTYRTKPYHLTNKLLLNLAALKD